MTPTLLAGLFILSMPFLFHVAGWLHERGGDEAVGWGAALLVLTAVWSLT